MANVVAVDTVTHLASYTPTTDVVVLYGAEGQNGTFIWLGGNQSAKVSADTQKGMCVPPSSDTTGASGTWIRDVANLNDVCPEWFGALSDGTNNDGIAIDGAMRMAQFPNPTLADFCD